jgi:hypothetical protein
MDWWFLCGEDGPFLRLLQDKSKEKQDSLEKGKTIKSFGNSDSSDEEKGLVSMKIELTIPSASLAKGESVKDMIRDHTSDEEEVAEIMAGMGFHGRATFAGIDLDITSISSALTTLIDVMEREGMEGRESFIVREYWCPNCLVSFKTFATPLLFMGRRERNNAPKKTKTNIAREKLMWRCLHSRWEVMKLMRTLTAEERSVVDGATKMGKGSATEILASQDGDSVQRGSMQTLRPGIWLNDEVINYFLKNCLKSHDIKICAKEPGRIRSHFFNSFFVQTMFDEKNRNGK